MKMALLFFKIFALMINTLLHSFKPFVIAVFPFLSRHLKNMVFGRFNCFFGARKSLTTQFTFDIREQEEVIGCQVRTKRRMSHQFDVLTAQKFTCLTRCVRARIVMMENDSSLAVVFTNFFEDFRQTNGRVYHSELTVLKRNSGHMIHSAEETGDHLLRRASSTNNFCWIWLDLEYPHGRLLFCFRLIRIYPWFVTCHDFIHVFWSTTVELFNHFLTPIDASLFLTIDKLWGIQREQIFLQLSVHAKSNVLKWNLSLSHDMSHDDLALSVHALHRCFVAQQPILDDLHGIRRRPNYDYDWIRYTSDILWFLTVLYRH